MCNNDSHYIWLSQRDLKSVYINYKLIYINRNMESTPLLWSRWIIESRWSWRLWYNIYCGEEALTPLWSWCVNSTVESTPRQWSNIWTIESRRWLQEELTLVVQHLLWRRGVDSTVELMHQLHSGVKTCI